MKIDINNIVEEIDIIKKYQRSINKKCQDEFAKLYDKIGEKDSVNQNNISEINLKIHLLHENQSNNLSKIKALRTSAEEYT